MHIKLNKLKCERWPNVYILQLDKSLNQRSILVWNWSFPAIFSNLKIIMKITDHHISEISIKFLGIKFVIQHFFKKRNTAFTSGTTLKNSLNNE